MGIKKESIEALNKELEKDMRAELSQKNIKFTITHNEHGGFNLDIPEMIINDAVLFDSFKSVESAVDFIVNEMMVIEPDEIESDSTQMLNPVMINEMADWVLDSKLDDPDNYEERQKVYMSRNPRAEAIRIATRIVRAQMARKKIKEIVESL